MSATTGRPVLAVDRPDHRHGFGWRLYQLREAASTVRWHVLTAVWAMVATVAPRVRAEAWREGFDVALGNRSGQPLA